MSAPQPTFQSMLQALRRARARCAAIARATGCPDAQSDAAAHAETESLVIDVMQTADDVMPIIDRHRARRQRAGGAA